MRLDACSPGRLIIWSDLAVHIHYAVQSHALHTFPIKRGTPAAPFCLTWFTSFYRYEKLTSETYHLIPIPIPICAGVQLSVCNTLLPSRLSHVKVTLRHSHTATSGCQWYSAAQYTTARHHAAASLLLGLHPALACSSCCTAVRRGKITPTCSTIHTPLIPTRALPSTSHLDHPLSLHRHVVRSHLLHRMSELACVDD